MMGTGDGLFALDCLSSTLRSMGLLDLDGVSVLLTFFCLLGFFIFKKLVCLYHISLILFEILRKHLNCISDWTYGQLKRLPAFPDLYLSAVLPSLIIRSTV